jgi:AcrR family transcriptional regulator
MNKPFSRTRQRELKRRTIISVASRLFNYQGSKATTLDEIANNLGLTKTSIYYYARNKEELVYMCYVAACDDGDEIFAPHSAMLIEIPVLSPEHRREIEARVKNHVQYILDFLQRGKEDGSIARCEPVPTARAFLGLVNWSYVWFGRTPKERRAEVVDQLIDLVKYGISSGEYRFHSMELPEQDTQLVSGFDRERQNLLKRNAFLRAGAMMFNERGYRGTSLDEVTQQLDVTKGAFYYHIETKEDLLYQCFQRMLELESETIENAFRMGRSGAEKIEFILRHLFNIQHSEEGPLIGYRSLLSLNEERRHEILAETLRLSDELGKLISEGIEDGSIRNVDPQIIENAIAGTVDGRSNLRRLSSADFQRNSKPPDMRSVLVVFVSRLIRSNGRLSLECPGKCLVLLHHLLDVLFRRHVGLRESLESLGELAPQIVLNGE